MQSVKPKIDPFMEKILSVSINPRSVVRFDTEEVVYVNEAFLSNFGYSSKEVLGRKSGDFWVNQNFIKSWKIELERAGTLFDFPTYIFDVRGEIRTVILNSMIVESDGISFAVNELYDLTEKEKIATSLQSTILKLHDSMESMISVIAHTVELKDPYTAGHQKRVGVIATQIAREMGLPDDVIQGISVASVIHDIGKIAIPVEILSKPGKLSAMEFELIKTHSKAGYEILKDVEFSWPLAEIVYQHHERLDGSGYPRGLKNGDILLEARIISVADVVEAISCHRPYRASLGMDIAMEEIMKKRGEHFDPDVVDCCLGVIKSGIISE